MIGGKKKSVKKDQLLTKHSYVQWNVYQHLKIFCEDYAHYKIKDPMLSKDNFIKNLQFDNYVKMAIERPDKTTELFFIIESDLKSLTQVISKLDEDVSIIHPTAMEKLVVKLVNKFPDKVIDYYDYNVFKLILPNYPGAPTYKILNSADADDVCNTFKCDISSFSKIKKRDPFGRWFLIKNGDLIRVIYNSETIHEYESYRYCK